MAYSMAIPRIRRLAALLLCLVLMAAFMLPAARAQSASKTVRVGWYDSPFNLIDQFGRRSGYAYEYQRKISAYTGWQYEYVEGSWPELLEMLKNGEIDLMSDVSYVPERAESMLFSALPMGTEAYYVFVAPDETEITSDDYASLNGKRVGVNKGSVQRDFFLEWEKNHSVETELIDMTGSEQDSQQRLLDGEIDAYIAPYAYMSRENAMPLYKIGASDFFFAVNKSRPDLLSELDAAMNRIKDENKLYNQTLLEKYLNGSGTNLYLDTADNVWLAEHGAIRVGYQDNYMAFCASDKTTGELTGALKDYLAYAATGMRNAHIDFEAVAYPTASAAIEALNRGEIDCMFPANLTDFDGEALGVVMTPPLMRTEMDAVVSAAKQKSFINKENVKVAVNAGNPNYDMFLVEHFPGWETVHYKDTPACLDAVAAGEADCIIISNYRFSNISKQCEKLRLTTVYTGVDMDYCFAVRMGDTQLYSVLARIAGMVPDSVINTALTYYSTEDARFSLGDFIWEHMAIVTSAIAAVLLVILLLLLHSVRAERKANAEHRLVTDLNRRVFVDALTSVRNKGAFADYIQHLQDQADQSGEIQFAIAILDCDNLKQINDQYGHDKGDIYLKAASRLICRVFQHSPVFRIGGDEFAVVLQNEDYQNRVALVGMFDAAQKEACAAAEHSWDEVHVAMGIAVYDPQIDHYVIDTERRADKAMYENKRLGKDAR